MIQTSSRRDSRTMTKASSRLNPIVGTTTKSMAANLRRVSAGGANSDWRVLFLAMYLATDPVRLTSASTLDGSDQGAPGRNSIFPIKGE